MYLGCFGEDSEEDLSKVTAVKSIKLLDKYMEPIVAQLIDGQKTNDFKPFPYLTELIAGKEELIRNWIQNLNDGIDKIGHEYENFQNDKYKCWEISYESEKCLKLFGHYENVFQHLFKDMMIDFSGFSSGSTREPAKHYLTSDIDFTEMLDMIQFMRGSNQKVIGDGYFKIMVFFKIRDSWVSSMLYGLLPRNYNR